MDLNEFDINNISQKILSQFENIDDLILSKDINLNNDIYIIYIINCPSSFYNKYTNNSKNYEEILSIDLNYNNLLHIIFEHFEKSVSNIISKLIENYLKIKNKNNIEFEDFILLLCDLIKFYSGLKIHITFDTNNFKNKFFLIFYGNENIFENLSQFFNYELQLKPYAYSYEQKNEDNKKNLNHKNDEKLPLLQNLIDKNESFQFEDIDFNNPIYFPPFSPFKISKKNFYRLYNQNDTFSDDLSDINSSKFRNIDKLRLMNQILDFLLILNEMKKNKILFSIYFHKNREQYDNDIKDNIYLTSFYNSLYFEKKLYQLRNYYGESFFFYFLFFNYYTILLIIPSILGIILFLSYYFKKRVPFISIFSNQIEMDYYDVLLITFCLLICLWLTLFFKIWNQKELFYSYIYGTSNYKQNYELNEDFIPDSKEKLILGYFIPYESVFKHKIKKIISNVILLFMIFIVILFIYYLFRYKNYLVYKYSYHYLISMFIASLNGLQIKIFNLIYYYIAKKLNDWENHSTINNKNNDLAFKLILFDFMNSYSSLFYIAFIKPYNEGCVHNNCLKEIEVQIYTIFLIYLALFIIEILYPIYFYKINKKYINRNVSFSEDNEKEEEKDITSVLYQIYCYPCDTLNFEYNYLINQFGYVILFSVAAPLTPFFMLILAIIGRITGYYKLTQLYNIDFLSESTGIGFYNVITRNMIFIGMCNNVLIVLFSNPNFVKNPYSVLNQKIIIFAITENLFLLFFYFIDWNILPNLNNKNLYYSKFLFKDEDNFKNKNELNIIKK